MFARRLRWFVALLLLGTLALVARLADIQIVHADQYETLAGRILSRPVRYVRPPRGRILDRAGRVLVADEPAADICVHYAVLAGKSDYLSAVARALRSRGEFPRSESIREISHALQDDVRCMWARLAELTGLSLDALRQQADERVRRVDRLRDSVLRRSPTVQSIAEENELLPVVEDIDNELGLTVRLDLEQRPWLRVVPGSRRVAHDDDALVHVLGRLGAATRERIDDDPLAESDELRRLRPGDRCGTSGVERVAEPLLRGARGRVVEDFDRTEVERVDPVAGRDVRLTIDLELQKRALEVLRETVEQHAQHPSGAAAVVIDVRTRDVVVLASYPTYPRESFHQDYDALCADTRHLPLLFRAASGIYPPGSTCKAITLVGGLSEGVVNENMRFHCTGELIPNKAAFRCWIWNQNPGVTHDMDDPAGQNAESAIRNSCNIYFFRVGERLGPQRLCEWFSRFGIGRTQGTGLIEEARGIVPTHEWLINNEGRDFQTADAWNFSIGQGEVSCTPLQAANVCASVACGEWRPVRLVLDEAGNPVGAPAGPAVPFDENALRVLRAGMWRVVNERGGTGHAAQMDTSGYELCGKTGSAQAVPRPVRWRYVCQWPDGRREDVIATSRDECLERFGEEPPVIVGTFAAERFPNLLEGEKLPSHAWFMGYTQPKGTRRGDVPAGRVYAIAVLIEFGGSGGKIAGPAAKKIMEAVLEADGSAAP